MPSSQSTGFINVLNEFETIPPATQTFPNDENIRDIFQETTTDDVPCSRYIPVCY